MARNKQQRFPIRKAGPWKLFRRRVFAHRVNGHALPWRCHVTAEGLLKFYVATKYRKLYIGDAKLARLAGCCAKSVQRAKADFAQLGMIELEHTRGGRTLDASTGKVRENATGYEVKELAQLPPAERQARTPKATNLERLREIRDRWGDQVLERDRELARQRAGP